MLQPRIVRRVNHSLRWWVRPLQLDVHLAGLLIYIYDNVAALIGVTLGD
mgnify:CR=1 FL=1